MTQPQRTVVLLHGYLESADVWQDFAHRFPADYRVITPNLPGYGPAAQPAADYSLEAAAEHVLAELDAQGAGQVVLVGHSMGGYVALAFAEKYPGRVAGLCLFHAAAAPDDDDARARRDFGLDRLEQR